MPEKIVWDEDIMECGHRTETARFYIDYDNVIRVKYICEEGCETPWLKLKKAPPPHDIKFNSDPYARDYVPKSYIWNKIFIGDIIPFKDKENDEVEDYEVAYKLLRQYKPYLKPKKILYLRPIGTGENVLAEFWEDGSLHFSEYMRAPFTKKYFQGWTEEELEEIKKRVILFIEEHRVSK